MPKNLPRDDLFAIFPDLRWPRHRISAEHIEPTRRQATATRENIARQQAATERVRATIAGRHDRKSKSRKLRNPKSTV